MPNRPKIACRIVLLTTLGASVIAAAAEPDAVPSAPPRMVVGRPPAAGPSRLRGPVVETRGTTRAGGWKASGRFMNTMRATVGGDGAVSVDCVPSSGATE